MLNRNDWIKKGNRRYFRAFCDICGADKGYKNPESDKRPCYSCNGKKANEASLKVRQANKAPKEPKKVRTPAIKEKKEPTTNCQLCGKQFDCSRPNKKYCSPNCVTKAYEARHPDRVAERHKRYKINNREKTLTQRNNWYSKNKDKQAEYRKTRSEINRQYWKNRRAKDPIFKAKNALRNRINTAISGQKDFSLTDNIGCTWAEFKTYMEAKFYARASTGEVMSWENHGQYGWHIDHIRPLSSFDLSDPEQIKAACHYSNLQPLWAEDNLKKGDNIL